MNLHRGLAVAILAGLTVFLYQLADVFSKINDWSVVWNPPTVAQLLTAAAGGLVAVGAALGLDVKKLGSNGGGTS